MLRSISTRRTVAASVVACVVAWAGAAEAGLTVYSQGFESNTAGWYDGNNGWSGSVTRTAATSGMPAASGSYYAVFTQGGTTGNETGPFTRFDRYRSSWPGTYVAQIAIYLDPNALNAGDGFDYSVSSSDAAGGFRRDFIFHVTKDTSTGDLLVGGSNNTNFAPIENLETGNHYTVTTAGWYTFEHRFYDNGTGTLAVDLDLLDSSGSLLFTETRSDPTDQIGVTVGGNRYGWFTNIDVTGGIAVDDASLTLSAVPEPSLAVNLAGTLAVGGAYFWRRRRRNGPPSPSEQV